VILLPVDVCPRFAALRPGRMPALRCARDMTKDLAHNLEIEMKGLKGKEGGE
jgi:hypothetical protein